MSLGKLFYILFFLIVFIAFVIKSINIYKNINRFPKVNGKVTSLNISSNTEFETISYIICVDSINKLYAEATNSTIFKKYKIGDDIQIYFNSKAPEKSLILYNSILDCLFILLFSFIFPIAYIIQNKFFK